MASIKIALIVIARILNNAIAITDFLRDDNHCQPACTYFLVVFNTAQKLRKKFNCQSSSFW
jgi:hypothetical protein